MRAGPLLPLFRRPATVVGLAGVAFIALFVLAAFRDPRIIPLESWAGTDSELMMFVLWLLGMIVPTALGLAFVLARFELEAKPFSWTLPGLRRGLRRGTLMAALPVAAASGFLAMHAAPAGQAGPMALAGGAIGLLAFLSPLALDPAFPGLVRWGILPVWLTVAFRPEWVLGRVEGAPWIAAGVALVAAALLVERTSRPEAARVRHLGLRDWGRPGMEEGRLVRWLNGPGSGAFARRRPEPGAPRLLPWLRAGAIEGTGGSAGAFAVSFAMLGALVLYAHLMSIHAMIPFFAAMYLHSGHLRIGAEILHPISRRRRADLFAAAALAEVVLAAAACAVTLLLIQLLRVPTLPGFGSEPGMDWMPLLVATLLWAPLLHGASLWSPSSTPFSLDFRGLGAQLVVWIAYGGSSVFITRAVGDLPAATLLAFGLGAFVVGYLVLWRVIRWRYARTDLVRTAT